MERILDYLKEATKPDIRSLMDIFDVLYDRNLSSESQRELYYMYRGLALNDADRLKIRSAGLRYDITVINPGLMGEEYVKTLGHYHPNVPGTDLTYTEVYQVLEGRADYLLQKEVGGLLVDVALMEAASGDVVVIPPNYGHITINPGEQKLVMSNWVFEDFKSDYATIRNRGGGAYFELSGGRFVENRKYGIVPKLRRLKPKDLPGLGLKRNADMYALVSDLSKLDFLKKPQDYAFLDSVL